MTSRTLLALGACLAVAGCGKFNGQVADSESLLAAARGSGVTPVADLPRGVATFTGQSIWRSGTFEEGGEDFLVTNDGDSSDLTDNAVLVSDARLDVNFNERTLTGSLSNFVNEDDDELSGTLDVFGGYEASDSTAAVTAIIAGQLSNDDGGTDDVVGVTGGTFGGDNGRFLLLVGELRGVSSVGDVSGVVITQRD